MDAASSSAASNGQMIQSALQSALGNLGGGQKSWMLESAAVEPNVVHPQPTASATPRIAPVPKRGRGRPRKYPRPPPLSPTSPQLSNVESREQADLSVQSHITVFPSPSPSEEATATLPTPSSGDLSNGPSTNIDFFMFHRTTPDQPAQDSRRSSENRASGLANSPSPRETSNPSSHAPLRHSLALPRDSTLSYSTANPSPSIGQLRNGQAPFVQPQQHAHVQHTPTPQIQPTLSQHSSTNHDASPDHGSNPVADTWYTQQDCWEAINRFESTCQGFIGYRQDAKRLNVLKTAVRHQDWAYLTLHQYYCLLTHEFHVVPMALRSQPKLRHALGILSDVLSSNDLVSPLYRSFFARFPMSIENLGLRWPARFQHEARTFLLLLTHSPDYDKLRFSCDQQRHPPLAHELVVEHKMYSPTFQRLFFTSCLRWIFRVLPTYPGLEHKALAIFEQNRAAFHRRELASSRMQSQDIMEDPGHYAQQLRKLFDDHKAAVLRNHPPVAHQNPVSRQPPLLYTQHSTRHQSSHHPAPVPAALPSNHATTNQTSTPRMMQHIQGMQPPPPPRTVMWPSTTSSRPLPGHRTSGSTGAVQSPSRSPQAHAKPLVGVPLLPAPGWIQAQQRVPSPSRYALHQAYLRSPLLRAKNSSSQLYIFQKSYLLEPMRLPEVMTRVQSLCFNLAADEMKSIARDLTTEIGHCTRIVSETSTIIRLRCISWPNAKMPSPHEWATADTAWAPYTYFILNGTSLQQRRKVHYGKDQPIDLTHLVRDGINSLELTAISSSTDKSHSAYLLAVEVLCLQSHDSIKHTCLNTRRIPASEVLASIAEKLSPSSDDDDVAILGSNLTITLFDPFSASTMCAIPVRSFNCAHNDCFDLDTFLATRPRKGDVSMPDAWRCPICNVDARPHQLFVDGFLEDVKTELESKGMQSTRAIIVDADGVWTPKTEIWDGVRDDTPPPEKSWADKVVIDLSD